MAVRDGSNTYQNVNKNFFGEINESFDRVVYVVSNNEGDTLALTLIHWIAFCFGFALNTNTFA